MAAGIDREAPLLICYDGSDEAGQAIDAAAWLFGARSTLVLTVWQPTTALGTFAWSAATASVVNFVELDKAAADDAALIASEGAQIAERSGLSAEPLSEMTSGPIWSAILDVARRQDAAAIVVGSRGLTGVRSILLGSVSSPLVHHADRPTLVIPNPGATDYAACALAGAAKA
jgi:nucleotide-binding universal stress UspA family protein